MIIAVSDLHLGDPASNKEGFRSFIEQFLKPNRTKISNLILLGDILDLWRRNNSSVIFENLDVLNDLCSLGFHVHYIIGNHDFIMSKFGPGKESSEISQGLTCDPSAMTISDNICLEDTGKKFRFIHGHQMSYWYALPFYEAFSCAMCQVNIDLEDLSTVWKILERQTSKISPFVYERIQALSKEHQQKIENRLAGPLIGNTESFEESLIEDYALLRNLIEFKKSESNTITEIIEDIKSLPQKSKYFRDIKSYGNLDEIERLNSIEEVAGKFLFMWEASINWLNSNRDSLSKDEYSDMVNPIKRVSAMFCTELHSDEFLIHGHGHSSYIDKRNQMADCGPWIQERSSYIQIDDGEVKSILWPRE